jgi:hypothetical protein
MASREPQGTQRTRKSIPMRRVIFFLAVVAALLFCVWFLFEVLENARPRKLPAVQEQERSARAELRLLRADDAADRHAPRIAA